MLSETAISNLGKILSESYIEFIHGDNEFYDAYVQLMTEASLAHVYNKLGGDIDSDLAVELACEIQQNVSLVYDKKEE
jgi:hypothetical protein